MARPKKAYCTNCKGTNEKCHYLLDGIKCRKGKAKGKAVSQATKDKEQQYNQDMIKFYEQFELYCDIFNVDNNDISFYKWLKSKSEKHAIKYYRNKKKIKETVPSVSNEDKEYFKQLDLLCDSEETKTYFGRFNND